MEVNQVPFSAANIFNKLFIDYVGENSFVNSLIVDFPTIDSLRKHLADFNFASLNREVLTKEIWNQYSRLDVTPASKKNIDSLLSKKTFTVTTGHQLCLFTGPAYFIYKILSCIKICERLNAEFSDYHFVPVYWMAAEDHDLEEINHTYFFGKKIEWNIEGSGRAGELPLTGMDEAINSLSSILGDGTNAKEIVSLFEKHLKTSGNLGEYTAKIVNEIFGKYGLVILDGNTAPLKNLFAEEMKVELFENRAFKYVSETSNLLTSAGYPTQVNPRKINLFYAQKNSRERIEQKGNDFVVLNTEIKFSKEEIEREIDAYPERFSPNVVMRPLYQQKILPNIIYCGGPGELAYWLQYKTFFSHMKIRFPFLAARNFNLILDANSVKKWHDLGFELKELFNAEDSLIKDFVKRNAGEISLQAERAEIEKTFDEINLKGTEVDKTLSGLIAAEKQKALNSINSIEAKMNKALKSKHDVAVNQIKNIRSKIFIDGTLQERRENFFSFANKYGLSLVDELLSALPDPLELKSLSLIVP